MNIKKSFLVALAAVTAVASVSAITVSASSLGVSTEAVPVVVERGVPTLIKADLDGKVGNALHVKTELPANVAEGSYTFYTALVADKEIEAAFDAVVTSDIKDILELGMKDEDGKDVDLTDNAKVTLSTSKTAAFNKVFGITEDGEFVDMGAVETDDGLTFTNDGYTRFVLAAVYDEPISDPDISKESKPSTPSTPSTPTPSTPVTPTGDNNTAATAAVFAVMGVVALGTVLATTKMKKSSK